MAYQVRFYRGDYPARQRAANADNAICYVEHHFNAADAPTANYALCVVANNASERTKNWGRSYTRRIAAQFGNRDNGISVGGFGGRGNANLRFTEMPAVLLEPFFISNPEGARWARDRQDDLAQVLVASIREFFPNGGLVAFSVGHKYKTSSPNDRGADSVLGGPPEAELAEQVLFRAQALLEASADAAVEAATATSSGQETAIAGDEVSDWAREARDWAVRAGFTDGLRAKDPVTREELWAMAFRAFGRGDSNPNG